MPPAHESEPDARTGPPAAGRRALAGAAAAIGLALASAPAAAQDIELEAVRARWRATFEQLDPDGGDDLWVTGLHYDLLERLRVLPPVYVGVGGYGATAGERGGLLVAGLTVGMRERLTDELTLDVGAFVGGGGGDFEPGLDPTESWGGGLYLRPHAALEFGKGLTRWRLEVSHVDVPGGDLQSTQIALGVQGFDELITAGYTFEDLGLIDPSALIEGNLPLRLGTSWLAPVGNADRRNGSELTDPILLGTVALERGVRDGWFVPIELAGAFGGSVSGYTQFLVGLGRRTWLIEDQIGLRSDVSAGAGGGGQVDTGGGLLLSTRTALEFHFGTDWSAHLGGGFQIAPTGDFQAVVVSLGGSYSPVPLELRNGYPRALLAEEGLYSFDVELEPWTIELLNKLYALDSSVTRTDGSLLEDDVTLIGLGISKQFAEHWEFSTRAYTAYDGELPGYHEGQLGVRYTLDEVLEPLRVGQFYLQYHVGAGGGGGLANGSGLTHNLAAGWRWRPWHGIRFGFEAGRLESEQGDLDGDLYAFTIGFGASRPLVADAIE